MSASSRRVLVIGAGNDEIVNGFRQRAAHVVVIQDGLQDAATAERAIGSAAEALGGIDVLVNASHPGEAPYGMTAGDFDHEISHTVRRTFLGCKFAAPHLRDESAIINVIASDARSVLREASRGASVTLVRGLAFELAPRIRVTGVIRPIGASDVRTASLVMHLADPRSSFLTGNCVEAASSVPADAMER